MSFFEALGPNYFVRPEEDPQTALNKAASILGKTPIEVLKYGWGGPIHQLMHHPAVRDIIIQHDSPIWIRDSSGKKTTTPTYLSTKWIDFLAYHWRYANLMEMDGREVPMVNPLANFRHTLFFPEAGGGIRFQYVGQGFSALGSSIYIRRLPSRPFELSQLVKNGTMPQGAADCLISLIKAKAPIIVSGQTGSGKTTLLGALVSELQKITVPLNLLVVEKSHELPLLNSAYRWEEDAEGLVGLEHLAANATQMGLEWLVLGESTGPEAYYVLKAFAQGVPVMTTLHATSATDGISGLAMLALEHVRDSAMLPSFLRTLATQAVISIHLEQTETSSGVLMGQVTGIVEMIDVSGTKPVINPIWHRKRDKASGGEKLVYNAGCTTQFSNTTKFRLHVAGQEFPPKSVRVNGSLARS